MSTVSPVPRGVRNIWVDHLPQIQQALVMLPARKHLSASGHSPGGNTIIALIVPAIAQGYKFAR